MVNYLPIGSVVKLDEIDELFMIVGLAVENEDKEMRDYLAVKYPVGVINLDNFYFFNHDNIKEIVYEGYKSIHHESYNDLLNSALSRLRNDEGV